MCTAYIATLGLIYAGTTAAGGLTALALKMLRAKTGARRMDPTTQTPELDKQEDGNAA